MIPGGFSEEGEMPQQTAEREVLEETKVYVKTKDLVAVRFMPIEEVLSSNFVVDTTKKS